MDPAKKKVYSGKYLTIHYDPKMDLFHQKWLNSDNMTLSDFKSEMLKYTECYREYKPKNTLWDQQGFTLILKPEDHLWIEENVNIPCKEYGNEKCAFVVGKDVLAHLTVMDSFEEPQSCIVPKHFSSIADAHSWIYNSGENQSNFNNVNIEFIGSKDGLTKFKLTSNSKDAQSLLTKLKKIQHEYEFHKKNAPKFYTLTKEEKEIFIKYSKGKTISQIAVESNTSDQTVRTLWESIQRKLDINSMEDIQNFANAFL